MILNKNVAFVSFDYVSAVIIYHESFFEIFSFCFSAQTKNKCIIICVLSINVAVIAIYHRNYEFILQKISLLLRDKTTISKNYCL